MPIEIAKLDEKGAQLCSTELTPLGKSGGAVELEIFAAAEMALALPTSPRTIAG